MLPHTNHVITGLGSLVVLVLVLNEVFPAPTEFAAPVDPVYVVAIKPVAVGTAVAVVLLIAGSRVRVD